MKWETTEHYWSCGAERSCRLCGQPRTPKPGCIDSRPPLVRATCTADLDTAPPAGLAITDAQARTWGLLSLHSTRGTARHLDFLHHPTRHTPTHTADTCTVGFWKPHPHPPKLPFFNFLSPKKKKAKKTQKETLLSQVLP